MSRVSMGSMAPQFFCLDQAQAAARALLAPVIGWCWGLGESRMMKFHVDGRVEVLGVDQEWIPWEQSTAEPPRAESCPRCEDLVGLECGICEGAGKLLPGRAA